MFWLMLLVGGLWSFFVAVILDRPDQITFLPHSTVTALHVGFAVFILLTTFTLARAEIRNVLNPWRNGPVIMLRVMAILAAGEVLMIFISRELLHGIDPSGLHKLW